MGIGISVIWLCLCTCRRVRHPFALHACACACQLPRAFAYICHAHINLSPLVTHPGARARENNAILKGWMYVHIASEITAVSFICTSRVSLTPADLTTLHNLAAGASPSRPIQPTMRSRTPPPLPPSLHTLPPPRATARGMPSTSQPPTATPSTQAANAGSQKKESFLDKLKKAAAQPALAGPMSQPSLSRMGDAAIASLVPLSRTPSENG